MEYIPIIICGVILLFNLVLGCFLLFEEANGRVHSSKDEFWKTNKESCESEQSPIFWVLLLAGIPIAFIGLWDFVICPFIFALANPKKSYSKFELKVKRKQALRRTQRAKEWAFENSPNGKLAKKVDARLEILRTELTKILENLKIYEGIDENAEARLNEEKTQTEERIAKLVEVRRELELSPTTGLNPELSEFVSNLDNDQEAADSTILEAISELANQKAAVVELEETTNNIHLGN